MSPVSQGGWNGVSLPMTLRPSYRPTRSAEAYPQMTDVLDVRECRAILGNESPSSPSWQALDRTWDELPGWEWDDVLKCCRWADHLLSEEEREAVARAREACALEEVGRGL